MLCEHCSEKAIARGLCRRHYAEEYRNKTLIPRKRYKQSNQVVLKKSWAEIILTNAHGEEIARTIVDKESIPLISKHRCHYQKRNGYACILIGRKITTLHRFLTNFEGITDHINRNKLDNRICNLREATPSQNNYNQTKQKNNQSGYKGVSYDKYRKGPRKWRAQGKLNGKNKKIGRFTTALEAAHAYDAFAKQHHGEFACLNFPDKI